MIRFLIAGGAIALSAFSLAPQMAQPNPPEVDALLSKYSCTSCHSMDRRLVGPTWKEIASKQYSKKRIIALVKKPEPGNWPGYPPMAAQATIPKEDLGKIADWLVALK
jgi:cytochrome c